MTGPEAATHQELLAALDNFANLDGQLQGFIEIGEGAAMFEVSEQPGPQQSSEADSLSTVEQEYSQAELAPRSVETVGKVQSGKMLACGMDSSCCRRGCNITNCCGRGCSTTTSTAQVTWELGKI